MSIFSSDTQVVFPQEMPALTVYLVHITMSLLSLLTSEHYDSLRDWLRHWSSVIGRWRSEITNWCAVWHINQSIDIQVSRSWHERFCWGCRIVLAAKNVHRTAKHQMSQSRLLVLITWLSKNLDQILPAQTLLLNVHVADMTFVTFVSPFLWTFYQVDCVTLQCLHRKDHGVWLFSPTRNNSCKLWMFWSSQMICVMNLIKKKKKYRVNPLHGPKLSEVNLVQDFHTTL